MPLRPEFFEVPFGQRRGGNGPPSTEEPLELIGGDRIVRIGGRIDRLDTGRVAGTNVFNVLDYKTGGSVRFSVEAVARGIALQLPLYAMAAVDVVLVDRDCVPWQAGYWYLRDRGFKPKQALKMYHAAQGSVEPEESWETMREMLGRTVAGLVRGMRGGQFPVSSADPHCTGYCEYATVCRINHIRALEKTWQLPSDQD
jgi:RecB family exonuclease